MEELVVGVTAPRARRLPLAGFKTSRVRALRLARASARGAWPVRAGWPVGGTREVCAEPLPFETYPRDTCFN